MSRLFFTLLLATHYPGEEPACTTTFTFEFGEFLVKFLLLAGKGFWCDDFDPDKQIPGLPAALHTFGGDLQRGVELDTCGDFQVNMPFIYRFDLD